MRISRDWATPLAIGAFGVVAVTGVLLFFHVDSGLNKVAHEWLSWVLLAGVVAHAAANVGGLRRHLGGTRGRALVAAFAVLLAASFVPAGTAPEPPSAGVVRAVSRAPLAAVAQLAGTDEPALRRRLEAAGVDAGADAATIEAAVGTDLRRQVRALRAALAPGD